MHPLIELKNVFKQFNPQIPPSIRAISANIYGGCVTGLVGPDGAGKTTLLRLMAGLLNPSEGEIKILGKNPSDRKSGVRGILSYMPQKFGLYEDLTVMENLNLYADLQGVFGHDRHLAIDRLLTFTNLGPFTGRLAGRLSGGMKQKLGLACALIHTPEVLFLDEPTNGVDPVSRRDFWLILYKLMQDSVTIFVSTAYLDEAERCSRVGLMHQGKLMALGAPSEVKKLMRGSLLEISCTDTRRAAGVLKASGLGSAAVFGDRLHLEVDDPKKAGEAIRASLRSAGMEGVKFRVAEPTLEDVFVSMLSGKAP